MNWDTKQFIHKKEYFDDLINRHLEIVLEFNPNPLGMFVRVLRHLIQKNAESISFESLNACTSWPVSLVLKNCIIQSSKVMVMQ